MDIKPIRTEEEYEEALQEIELLFDAPPGSPEESKMEVLAILVDAYEEEHYAIPLPDPIEAIKFHMERLGLRNKDMVPYLSSPSRVSEVLNRKRKLTLKMIRKIHKALDIPLEVLAQEYELEKEVIPLANFFKTYLVRQASVYKTDITSKESTTSSGTSILNLNLKDTERIALT